MARKIHDLGRKPSRRTPKAKFYIYCEGKNTEPQYFRAVRDFLNGALIDVITFGDVGDPRRIATEAIAKSKMIGCGPEIKRKHEEFAENDQVWAVFDRDNHHHFEEAIRLCKINRVYVAYSIPCFEVWFILHCVEYYRCDDQKNVQKFLKSLRPEYDPDKGKCVCFRDILSEVEVAEERAKRLLEIRRAEGNIFEAPSTTVFQLTSSIREAADRNVR